MEIGPLQNKRQVIDSIKEKTDKQPVPKIQKKQEDRLDLSSIRTRDKLASLADEMLMRYGIDSSYSSENANKVDGTKERNDKIRLARARVKSGFYEQPDIMRKVAEKLADKLANTKQEDNFLT